MAKEQLTVNDFDLFIDIMKSLAKFAEGAKIYVDTNGLTIYSRNECARCEITSNAVTSSNRVEFNISELGTFVKIIQTVKDVHDGDYSTLKFIIDDNLIKLESKKFKTKLNSMKEELIAMWISQKFNTELTPVFEFTTSSDIIKKINSHSYIIRDEKDLRIYLAIHPEMENNTLYATIGNNSSELNNSITLKFGMVTFGKLDGRTLIFDSKRLNIFNMIQSNNIKIQLMDKNVCVSNINVTGKNNTYFDLVIYNSLRKN